MKPTFVLGLAFLACLPIGKAAPSEEKKAQILVNAKFMEMPSKEENPTISLEPQVYTDPQFQIVIRSLVQRKGTDVLSAPQISTIDGQPTKVEIARKFEYNDELGKKVAKDCGITFSVLPKVNEGDKIDLELSAQILAFERFEVHQNGWKEPIFKEHKIQHHLTVRSGSTVVVAMEPRTEQQIVIEGHDTGHLQSSKIQMHTICTLVCVTAQRMDSVLAKPNASQPRKVEYDPITNAPKL